jgi:hypothetical protein
MEWKNFGQEKPEEGKLLIIWRKCFERFVAGYHENGPVRKANSITKASLELSHWKSSISGNNLKQSSDDYWIYIPELRMVQVFK